MSDFDAKLEGFIRQHLNQCIAKSERITGGMVNYTFRLYLKDVLPPISSENSNEDRLLTLVHQLKPKSLIIKVGFPYVVELGESVPFPIIRQQVEERVLNLFTDWSSYATDHQPKSANLSSVSARNKTIKIARAWFCDEINNVLVMDDHGSLPNMEQWFATHKSSSNIEPIIAASQLYGKQMGSFLADMQVSSLPQMEHLDKLLFGRELLKLDLSDYGDMFEHLREPYNLSDADDLRSIFMQWYEYDASREATDGKVLAHGDLWAPNFLINQEDLTLGMVDWECATVRSPAHDPALLLGRFQILMASAPANGPVNSFINAFIDSYRESANKLGASWYKNEREKYLFAWYLGIMYAVSMMFWSMIKSCCSDRDEICSHRRAIVSQGAKYLRECRVGPGKVIYDVISHDPFLGRLFQEPIVGETTSH